MYEKTAAPIPPVGAGGEQPQFKETISTITETTWEIKTLFDKNQEHTVGRPSPGGPVPPMNFLTRDSKLPTYIQYPRFLLESTLNETAQLLYAVLLDRAKLSMKKAAWSDQHGRVFIHYPIAGLAETMHKSETTVKTALTDLESAGLILRQGQGIGKPSLIYVRIPTAENLSATGAEICPSRGRISDESEGENLSGSKNNIVRTTSKKEESKSEPMAYGSYKNVFLTVEEYKSLYQKIRNLQACINRLSEYMHTRGRTYPDHAATLLRWAEQDGNLIPQRNYDCQEGESL